MTKIIGDTDEFKKLFWDMSAKGEEKLEKTLLRAMWYSLAIIAIKAFNVDPRLAKISVSTDHYYIITGFLGLASLASLTFALGLFAQIAIANKYSHNISKHVSLLDKLIILLLNIPNFLTASIVAFIIYFGFYFAFDDMKKLTTDTFDIAVEKTLGIEPKKNSSESRQNKHFWDDIPGFNQY